jgi:hypothetical protein
MKCSLCESKLEMISGIETDVPPMCEKCLDILHNIESTIKLMERAILDLNSDHVPYYPYNERTIQ